MVEQILIDFINIANLTGMIFGVFGSITVISADIWRKAWLNCNHPPFPRLRRWKKGRTTYLHRGEIAEGDYGFDELKKSVKRGRRYEGDFHRIIFETPLIDPDPVRIETREGERQLGHFVDVEQWMNDHGEYLVKLAGLKLLVTGVILQVVTLSWRYFSV